ncbi:uncharacterized protein [Clytia hemisphaerica]|uniref:Cnidarian restricted protein n=1 Tax=Clytia hemisphaerica TaxID=252671 RepID=A0A7M5WZI0_9CNID
MNRYDIVLLATLTIFYSMVLENATAKSGCGFRWRIPCPSDGKKRSMMAASKKNMDHKYDLNQIENDILAEVMHENHLNDVEDGPSRDNLYTEKNIRHRASLDLSNKREQQQTADELSRLHKMGAKLLESYYDEMKRGTSEKFDDDDDMDEINF